MKIAEASLFLAALLLAGCGQPQSSTSIAAAPAEQAMPVPGWVAPYMGKKISEVFITSMTKDGCIGNADAISSRFAGPPAGIVVVGWGWSTMHRRAYTRILATDANGVIVGGGTTDTARPDVVAGTHGTVTTPTVGFTVVAQGAAPVSIFGVDETASTQCPLGVMH